MLVFLNKIIGTFDIFTEYLGLDDKKPESEIDVIDNTYPLSTTENINSND